MSLSLVVLAAGMGSRYGGLKQIDPVGPGGETVLDYAVFDALRAGFDHVVFVIRRDFEQQFRDLIGARYVGKIAIDYAFQSVEMLPTGFAPVGGREKPWGTGHAVWCAREAVDGNFAVINADDFYGLDSFRRLAAFLTEANGAVSGTSAPGDGGAVGTRFAMVGFRLERTLSENGAVSRGVCATGADGALRSIVEQPSILAAEIGPGRRFSGEEIVSMNCWGFTPALFALLEARLREFIVEFDPGAATRPGPGSAPAAAQAGPDRMKAEFYLPAAVSAMIVSGEAAVSVLPTRSSWFGITYRADKPRVAAAIEDLVRSGEYPLRLF